MIRDEIIKILDVEPKQTGLYDQLKDCLYFQYEDVSMSLSEIEKMLSDKETRGFDSWFKGIIHSLYYKTNEYVLVLEGDIPFNFIEKLFPEEMKYCYHVSLNSSKVEEDCNFYSSLVVMFSFSKKTLWLPKEDNFIIFEENTKKLIEPSSDKRLASYYTITDKWQFPQRNNFIVLHINSIDWDKFESIDKLELWREIFKKFKPDLLGMRIGLIK